LCGTAFVQLLPESDRTRRIQLALFLVAFAVRFAVSVAIYEFGLFQMVLEPDATGWLVGRSLTRRWTEAQVGLVDLPPLLAGAYSTNWGYYYTLGLLFFVTGTSSQLPAAALNGFAAALTTVFVYRIARDLFNAKVAERAGWLACLFPSLIIWSAQTLKEPIVILLETVGLFSCIRMRRSGPSAFHVTACVAATGLLLAFRFYAAYVVAIAAVFSLVLPRMGSRRWHWAAGVAATMIVGAIVVSSSILAREQIRIEQFDLDYVERFRRDVATQQGSRSGVVMNVDLDTPAGFVEAVLGGGAHLLLAPFPWHLASGNPRILMTTPDLLAWWWLFFFAFLPGVRYTVWRRPVGMMPLVMFTVGMGFLYSLMFGNIGLVYRQRAQLLPWLLIFAAAGLWIRHARREAGVEAREPRRPSLRRPAYRDAVTASAPQKYMGIE
jgi:4-amino-4-deoxy-L-arabinose transferase-like glycosyltransferase